ncbi:FAD-binding oxidoreductase [Psychromarinibacter sp. C21-152]|uniref:FAD-binding oxidoreductase n=1 Tax=Psychromarinibacter sediminicola TaxID=3033385 RepID=A0AAE3NJX8_9RHOB|nr:FAD-binding oxidoreductase [Psychromarinibacter sediminicola]MDF0599208.1 FAD-binding oxidoreductase [Psychromarinibacter sediminicola]
MTSDTGALWRASVRERVEAPPLAADAAVDLAIVGGGFTGCSAALAAAGHGASVCLLEAEHVGHGGSGRNVGLVNAGLWMPPDDICAAMGAAAGRRLIEVLAEAPARVFELIARHGIDCEATRNGTLHCAHAPAGLRDLQDRFRQGNRFGAPVSLLDADETARHTGAAGYVGALFDPRAGTVQPLAYCLGLARAAQAAGARLHGQSPVTALERDGDGWRLTANGRSIRAGAVLVATNAYHRALGPAVRPRFTTVHFSQFATAPLSERDRAGLLEGGEGCWDTALVMNAFRTDQAGRLILGAIGNRAGPAGAVHAAWARRKLKQLFPRLAQVPFEHAWTGRIAMTSDHLPRIVAFGPRALAVYGYSGRGIGPGTVFGAAAARALLTGSEEGLPVAPVAAHSERLTGLRSAYYEAGALLTHATRPAPFR